MLHGDTADGSAPVDSSGNNWSLTRNGGVGVTTAQQKFGAGSVGFNGTNQWLLCPDDSGFDLQPKTNWCIQGWFRPTASVAYAAIYTNWLNEPGNNNGSFLFCLHNLAPSLLWSPHSVATPMLAAATISLNTWTHLALVCEDGVCSLWRDGTYSASANFISPPSFTNRWTIGAYNDGASGLYAGQIDDLQIWNDRYIYNAPDGFTPTGPLTPP